MNKVIIAGIGISIVIFAIFSTSWLQSPVGALSGNDWRAGNIIDDVVFFDNNSMSTHDIQSFLNLKNPTCDTIGTQPATEYGRPNMTHAQYAASQGWPSPPYVCLKDYYQVPRSDQNINNLNSNVIPNGAISAAQIIKNAADSNGVSPKALIAILQKESPGPLVTDSWPLAKQYRNAMGYACPDTAPCDPKYEGFYNQMMNAAWQFKSYKNNSSNFRYKPFQANSIYYNPNYGCGAASVSIQNYATSGLYNYTPYQPNQAALNNLYGTGDSCSAYGNRNFWRIFSDWFGQATVADYAWQPQGQTVYKDSTKSQAIGWNSDALTGDRVYVKIIVKNTGSKTWIRNNHWPQVQIGTWYPQDRNSAVCDSTWIRCSRAATHNEATVAPGEIATFEFWAKTPTTPGSYGESFNLVADGLTWMQNGGTYVQFKSTMADYSWQPLGQTIYTDNSKQVALGWNAKVTPKQRVYAVVKVKNTSNVSWYKTNHWPQVQIGTWYPQDRNSAVCDSTWIRCSRAATHNEATVAPGEIATFEFWMQAPSSTGRYGESLNLVADGLTWMKPTGLYIQLDSAQPSYTWEFVWQGTFADQARTQPIGWNATAPAGSKVYATVKAKNTGNVAWYKTNHWPQVQIGTWYPQDRTSAACTSDWIRCSRAGTHNEDVVYPGQVATFNFSAQMPNVSGQKYGEALNLVADGLTWMNPTGSYVTFTGQ